MKAPLLIYGAGGLGREVLSLVRMLDTFEVVGFLDDGISKDTIIKGTKVIGGVEALKSFEGQVNIVLAFGDPVVKETLRRKIGSRAIFPLLKHPSVLLQDEGSVQIGAGTILCAGCILTTDIQIGDHVLINLNCTIGHDTIIGNHSSVMPGVNISGEVVVGESVLIGSGSNVLNRTRIGDHATVGMGSVVIRDVISGTKVAGVPAKVIPVRTR